MLTLYHLHRHRGQPIHRQYKLRVHSGQNWCSIEKEEPAICHPPWLGLTFNTHRETTLTSKIQKSFLYENCYFTAVGRWAVNRTDPQLWTDKRRNGTYWEEPGKEFFLQPRFLIWRKRRKIFKSHSDEPTTFGMTQEMRFFGSNVAQKELKTFRRRFEINSF